MAQLRHAISLLVAGGCLAVTSEASATTQVFNYSDQTTANIDLAGGADQFTIGPGTQYLGKQAFDFTPNGTSLVGTYSATSIPTSADTYSNVPANTGNTVFGIYTPSVEGTAYLNVEFDALGTSYVGTAEFTGNDSQTTLDSITYEPSAAPEPSEWALLLAGVGGAGMALRRRRQDGLSYSS